MIIVNFHNVLAHRPSAFNMLVRKEWLLVKQFERQISWLQDRYEIVSLDAIVGAMRAGEELPNACAITFDDGYLGTYRYAGPLLAQRSLPATFFVITGLMDTSGSDLHDRLEALVWLTEEGQLDLGEAGLGVLSLACDACKVEALRRLNRHLQTAPLAGREQVGSLIKEQLHVAEDKVAAYLSHEAYQVVGWQHVDDLLRRGFSVGSHSRTHASLSQVDDARLVDEVKGSLQDLVKHAGARELAFAYPYGQSEHLSEAAVEAVRDAGYSCAVTMLRGVNTPATDLFSLYRVTYRDLAKAETP